jgi:hypothetical protein
MDFQLIMVWVLVAAAAIYIVRSLWKSLLGSGKGCGSGCGKCATTKNDEKPGRIPLEQLKTR